MTRSPPAKAIPTARSRSTMAASASGVSSPARPREYFRPGRVGFKGNRACDPGLSGSSGNTSGDWSRLNARWWSATCHRSLYGYQVRAALAIAIENPHSRGHLPAARLFGLDHRSWLLQSAARARMPADRRLRRQFGAADGAPERGARSRAQDRQGAQARRHPAHDRCQRHLVLRPRRQCHHRSVDRAHAVRAGRHDRRDVRTRRKFSTTTCPETSRSFAWR